MRKLLTSRAFYCVVCLILVCVLVVNVSPIRARAVGVDQFVGVAIDKVGFYAQAGAVSTGAAVFSWVLLGLGLIVTTVQAVELMNDYMEWSGELETSIYYYPDGSWSYGVDLNFIQKVRAFLFNEGILYLGPQIDTSMPASVVEALGVARANGCHYFYGTTLSGKYPFVAYCNDSNCLYLNYMYGFYQVQCGGSPHTFVYKDESSTWSRSDGIQIKDGKIYKVGETEPVQTTDDTIELGTVAAPQVDIPTGYPEWHTNARPVTNPDTEEEITVLPIPLNPSVDLETQIGTLTQSDVWQGSIADPLPDTDTNPDTGNDLWSPSGDMQHFTLDLKEYFPFCIPFDLYDFFTCLNADPVAPVIEWVIPLPGGDTYPLELDLSTFDPVAQLLRRLQLLLFCVGLAFKTRDLIKG